MKISFHFVATVMLASIFLLGHIKYASSSLNTHNSKKGKQRYLGRRKLAPEFEDAIITKESKSCKKSQTSVVDWIGCGDTLVGDDVDYIIMKHNILCDPTTASGILLDGVTLDCNGKLIRHQAVRGVGVTLKNGATVRIATSIISVKASKLKVGTIKLRMCSFKILLQVEFF